MDVKHGALHTVISAGFCAKTGCASRAVIMALSARLGLNEVMRMNDDLCEVITVVTATFTLSRIADLLSVGVAL